jgi:hypothetical protein
VRPHDKDLLRPAAAAQRYFEICTGMAGGLIPLERDLIALLAPFRLDVLAGGGQCRGPEDIALADLAGEGSTWCRRRSAVTISGRLMTVSL